jgi:hypothetical protein
MTQLKHETCFYTVCIAGNLAMRHAVQQNLQICALSYTCKVANDSLYNTREQFALPAGRMTHALCQGLLAAINVCHLDETLTRILSPGAIILRLGCILKHTHINLHCCMTYRYTRYSCHFLGNIPNHSLDNSPSRSRRSEPKLKGYSSLKHGIVSADSDRFLQKETYHLSVSFVAGIPCFRI